MTLGKKIGKILMNLYLTKIKIMHRGGQRQSFSLALTFQTT